ncbi:MAG: hypothetical protein ACK5JU_08205 [Bacteroidales bacterium]
MFLGYIMGILFIAVGKLFKAFPSMNSVITRNELESYDIKKLSLFNCVTLSLIGFILIILQWWWNIAGYSIDTFVVLSVLMPLIGVLFLLQIGRSKFRRK